MKLKTNSTCYLCKSDDICCIFPYTRDNKNLKVLKCICCGLVFLSSFDHIKELFYENSGMHNGSADISKWVENTKEDDERRFYQFKNAINGKDVLDFGCGTGGFLLKSKAYAKSTFGLEPDRSLTNYFEENNLKVYEALAKVERKFDIITMFHVLEHIPDPISILVELKRLLKENGSIIIEVPSADDALISLYENKDFCEFTYWSCHLYMFNTQTLEDLINKSGYKINYIEQYQRYSITNHLYWLSNGKPGGHKKWENFYNDKLNEEYIKMLKRQKACDTLIASISL